MLEGDMASYYYGTCRTSSSDKRLVTTFILVAVLPGRRITVSWIL
jgi:hypothetical protein